MVSWRAGVSLAIALLIAGCDSSGDVSEKRLAQMAGGKLKNVVPVSGKVLVDGAPQQGVNLYLYDSAGTKVIAECRTDPEGAYCWTTHTECDGLEPGSYRLGFKYIPKLRRNEKGEDLFGGRYSNPMAGEFQLKVAEGAPQENVDYQLTTK